MTLKSTTQIAKSARYLVKTMVDKLMTLAPDGLVAVKSQSKRLNLAGASV